MINLQKKKIVIYGLGLAGKLAFENLQATACVMAICTSTRQSESSYKNIPLITPDQLAEYAYDFVIIATQFISQVKQELHNKLVPEKKIVTYETVRIIADNRLEKAVSFLKSQECRQLVKGDVTNGDQAALKRLLDLPCHALEAAQWTMAYDYLMYMGQFTKALPLRENAIEAAINWDHTHVSPCPEDRLLALVDQGRYEEGLDFIHTLRNGNFDIDQHTVSCAEYLLHVTNGELQTAQKLFAANFEHDKSATSIISEKSIAFVGPCLSNQKYGDEIDQFDLVIRLSPFPVPIERQPYAGSKTDIVCVGGHLLNYVNDESRSFFENKNTFYIYESVLADTQRNMVRNGYATTMKLKTRFYNGWANFMQRIIVDLLSYNIKQLKLFSFDLFTSKQRQSPAYANAISMDRYAAKPPNYTLLTQSMLHDFASSFNFSQLLLKNKVVEMDETLTVICSKTLAGYFASLEESFSSILETTT